MRRKWDDTVFPIPPRMELEGKNKSVGLAIAAMTGLFLVAFMAALLFVGAAHLADTTRQLTVLQQECQK